MLVLRLFPLKEVNPSPDRYKMIKFLTFDNFFSPLRVYDILATTRSRMTMAKHLPTKMTLVHVLALLSIGKISFSYSVLVLKPKALRWTRTKRSRDTAVTFENNLHSKLALRAKHDWQRSHNVFVWFCSYKELQYQTANTVNFSVYKSINIFLSFVASKIRYVVSSDMIFLKQNLPVQKWFYKIFFNITLQLMTRLTFKNFFHRES